MTTYDRFYDLIKQAQDTYGLLHQHQEMPETLEFLAPKNLKGFIEVGSAHGASFHCWGAVIPEGVKISVDLNYGFGIGPESNEEWQMVCDGVDVEPVSEQKYDTVYRRNNNWRNYFDNVVIVEGNSLAKETVQKVKNVLGGTTVDWIFIDGFHDFKSMSTDFNNYNQFLSDTGYIGFHDIWQSDSTTKFWNLVKSKFNNVIEIKHGTGIGIISAQEINLTGVKKLI